VSVLSAPEQRTALVTGAAGTMGRAVVVGLLADCIRVSKLSPFGSNSTGRPSNSTR